MKGQGKILTKFYIANCF